MTAPRPQPTSASPGTAAVVEATVTDRVDALRRFAAAAEPYLPAARLAPAHAAVTQVTQRLALPQDQTVVALAGATGGGKSSLFNAFAGRELSPVGVHRPTTGEAHACVWGSLEEAADLLDWLKVPPAHRHSRGGPPDRGGGAGLGGLVLLDLPDLDSLDSGHAAEVTRLLGQVDLVVWVMDPQKYADRVVHEEHLARFRHHRDATVVALNQADLLSAADLDRLLADLRRLLAEDGLDGALAIATSAVDTPAGLGQLRARLAEATGGHTVLARLSADMDSAVAELADLVGGPATGDGPAILHELTRGLARVAGAGAATEVVAASHRRRGTALTGWAVLRWLGRLRPDPLRQLAHSPADGHAAAADASPAAPRAQDVPVAPRAQDVGQQAAAGLVVREVARRASEGLPEPWRHAVAAAARSRLGALPGALDAALVSVNIDTVRAPAWWRATAAAQWAAAVVAVAGLGLLALQGLLAVFGGPSPLAGAAAGMAAGGLLVGAGLALLARPLVHRSARLARDRVAEQLRVVVAAVAQEHVVEPVQAVLRAYAQAREALAAAAR